MENNETINKNYIIAGLVVALFILVIGSMKFVSVSKLNNYRYGYDDVWDVAITNIKMVDNQGEVIETSKPTYSNKNASFDVKFTNPDSFIKYEITIKNRGTLNAKLKSYLAIPENDNKNIEYSIDESNINSVLKSGLESKYIVTIKYIGNDIVSIDSSKTLIFEYVQNK